MVPGGPQSLTVVKKVSFGTGTGISFNGSSDYLQMFCVYG
jgi:hypothetical protein